MVRRARAQSRQERLRAVQKEEVATTSGPDPQLLTLHVLALSTTGFVQLVDRLCSARSSSLASINIRAARRPLLSNKVGRTVRAANLRLRQRTSPGSSRAAYLSESAVERGEGHCAVTRETAAQAHRAAPNGFACPCPGRLERHQTDTSSSFPSRYAQYRSDSSLLSYCSYTLLGRPVGPAPVDSLRSRRLSAIFEPRSFPPFHLSCRPYPKTIRPSHRPLSPFQSYSTVF